MGIIDFFKSLTNKKNNNIINNDNNRNNIVKKNTTQVKMKEIKYFKEKLYLILNKYDQFINESEIYYKNNACPYCGCILDSKINKTKICPECKNKIIFKTNMYNRNKMIFKTNQLDVFMNYDDEIRTLKHYDKLVDSIMISDRDYISEFERIKNIPNNTDYNSIIWAFCNYCANHFEVEALRIYNKNAKEGVLEIGNAMNRANINWGHMCDIAFSENKVDIGFDLLTTIAYKEMIKNYLTEELFGTTFDLEKHLTMVFHSSYRIIPYLIMYNLKLKDFKEMFLNKNYSFLIFDKPKELMWKYIEIALINEIKLETKNGRDCSQLL